MTKQQRLETANQIIKIISEHGRHFFSTNSYPPHHTEIPRISHFVFAGNGRLWFVDKYTQRRIYTSYRRGRWRGFSDGGTLRSLVENLADYITKADPIRRHFGPWPDYLCGGDLWGYGPDMDIVRQRIYTLLDEVAA